MGIEFELKYAAQAADLEILKARYPHLHPIAMETTYYDTFDGKMGSKPPLPDWVGRNSRWNAVTSWMP